MKSEERHKLQQNTLADTINDISKYMKEQGQTILLAVIVVLMVIVGIKWFVRVQREARIQNIVQFQEAVSAVNAQQLQAVQAAQSAMTEDAEASETPVATLATYNVSTSIQTFARLAEENAGSSLGMMALANQAQAVLSELYYSTADLSDEQVDGILSQAEALFKKLQSSYGKDAFALGTSKIGLASIAEKRNQWDDAKALYSEIVENAAKYEGTSFVLQAKQKLDGLDDIQETIVFPPAPEVQPTMQAAPAEEAAEEATVAPEETSAEEPAGDK